MIGPLTKFARNAGVQTAIWGDVFECAYGQLFIIFVNDPVQKVVQLVFSYFQK